MNDQRHVLVTGGSGFIGSHVCESLLKGGCRVTVVDNHSTGSRANLSNDPALVVIERDVLDFSVSDWPKDIDAVVHLAAVASVADSWSSLRRVHEINLSSTVHLLEVARQLRIARFVLASSAAVYGDAEGVPLREDGPTVPVSPYGLQKLASERYGAIVSRESAMTFVALRFFNVFGPRQLASSPYSGVIALFAKLLHERQILPIRGDGMQTRDFVYVKDVAHAVTAAATSDLPAARFLSVNIGSGRATSVIELARVMGSRFPLGSDRFEFRPELPGEIRHSVGDIRRACELLAYFPRWSLDEGLAEFLVTGDPLEVKHQLR